MNYNINLIIFVYYTNFIFTLLPSSLSFSPSFYVKNLIDQHQLMVLCTVVCSSQKILFCEYIFSLWLGRCHFLLSGYYCCLISITDFYIHENNFLLAPVKQFNCHFVTLHQVLLTTTSFPFKITCFSFFINLFCNCFFFFFKKYLFSFCEKYIQKNQ